MWIPRDYADVLARSNLPPSFPNYYPFSDGPDEANRLLEGTQARWRALREA